MALLGVVGLMFFRPMPLALSVLLFGTAAFAMDDGAYRGLADGGTMTVTVRGSAIHIGVGGEGCGGEGEGSLQTVADGHWSITLKWQDATCILDVAQQGKDRFNVQSQGPQCSAFHGASCSFDGYVIGPAR